ncbi:MAG: PAS domain S-box protein [Deltaproteobacteria bacterium]|nr:PAS domain S-box protein [Deltaproteobacteria bacterium]
MAEREDPVEFLENIAVPIRQIAADGTIVWANRAELAMLGYSPAEYIGHHIAEFHADRAVVDDMCTRMAAGEPLHDYEARFVAKNGDIRHVAVSSNAYMRDGKLVHTRCVSRDVTESRRKESEREGMVADLARTVRLNDMFASILGHDLRNPLNAIVMATQMLIGQVTDPKAQRAAQRVLSSSERMRRMIDQLLDFSRARMLGGLPLERRDADLATIARDALEEVRFVRPGWPIEISVDGDTHGSWDSSRLAQVMSNLFGNAAQHGTADVPLDVRIDGTAPDKITMTLTNGGGIPPEILPMIFAPFRGRKHKDAKTQGLGLGLFISEQIVRAHQGDITADVKDDRTTFTVTLPRRPVVLAPATFERTPTRTTESAPLAKPVSPRKGTDDVMRTFVRGIRDYAIFMLDANGYIQTWNVGAQVITGYRQDEAIGRHFSIFYTREDLDTGKIPRELDVAQRTGQYEEEGWRVRKDGSHYWASVLITALRDDDNQVVGYAKVVRDLTERKVIEERERQNEQRFRILVESVKDYAIFMLDPFGNVASWNAGAQRIKHYTADEIIGRHFSVFYPEEDIRAGKCEMELEVAARVGRFEDEGWRLRKDGSRFWANVVITALYDSNGTLVGFGKVTRDLTERKQHEEERLRLAQAQEAVRLRDEFLSIASHELKTPLTVLQLQLDTLRDRVKQVDASLADKIERTNRASDRLTHLVDTLLDVSRIATGKFELHREPVDLSQVAKDVVERMGVAASAASCEIHAELVPHVEGSWDRIRIEQVITNLLGNAMKYAAGSSVDLRVYHERNTAVIEVRDRGPGLPADSEAIFARFERAASMRHYGGLGLGLYIVRQIAEAHGGNVSASNAAGGGAQFSVRLPCKESN